MSSENQIFHGLNSRSFLHVDNSFSNPVYIEVVYIQVVLFDIFVYIYIYLYFQNLDKQVRLFKLEILLKLKPNQVMTSCYF